MQRPSYISKINALLIILFSAGLTLSQHETNAQLSYKVLFLGNSYTGTNNLPQIIHDVALSAGDTLIFDSHTPGGYQLIDHYNDAISQNKISAGGWNYVILQGQSQEPVILPGQFTGGGIALFNVIKQYNPCAVTMPYMTWGRKNGDASNCANFPVMCTYQGMDSTLRNSYLNLTENINGEVSPVSVVWNFLRQNFPNLELYQPDESHPSAAGSYAAACCFYTSIFKKDPTLITFDFGLSTTDAAIIKNAVKTQVFDNLQQWDYKKLPLSDFGYQTGSGVNEVFFNAFNQNIRQSYSWDFGDAGTAAIPNPAHSYLTNGNYIVTLTTSNCDLQGWHTSVSDTVIQFCSHTPTIYNTQSWLCLADTLWTQPSDSYQWFIYGQPIPENNQFLANYSQYGTSGFSVVSTQNGCSELSEPFSGTPEWSGYYFDAIGNPCVGDTVAFAVLHINGFLSGLENIAWFKNDTLLSAMNNEDTLLISSSGKYECRVVNPNSICPLDTTSYMIVYDCGVVGVPEYGEELFWNVFPNPASETITIQFSNFIPKEQIQIYSAIGRLVKETTTSGASGISVADLPSGLYVIRLKNVNMPVLKFIKQ